ncbi:MAG: hypothetical protein ABFE08_22070 [Armatimonadia bacterium]
MRTIIGTVVVMVLLLGIVLPAVAQTADISLGGALVARLRDPGSFKTVDERAASVDKVLIEVISKEDTQHPQVALKQKGNLWTVYAWDRPVMAVYPAEAAANKMTEKALGLQWANKLRAQLPKATPCSKLPPEQLGYGKPVKVAATATTPVAVKPATAAPPAKPATTVKPVVVKPVAAAKPVAATAKPVAAVVKPAATVRPTSTMTGGESGAMLLIVDAMRTAREMNDQDWTAQKEAMARGLYGDLSYYLTGKGEAPKLPATTVVKPVTVKPAAVKPVVAKPAIAKPAAKPVATVVKPVTAKPVVAKPATAKPVATATKPATKPTAVIKPTTGAADPSMAKVPQKNRIRAKFAAVKGPFDKLKAADPQSTTAVAKMLTDSRQAFAYGNFDESERQVDAALSALGVEFKE